MSSAEQFLATFGRQVSEDPTFDDVAPAGGSLGSFLDKFGGPPMTSYFFYNNTVELRFDKESWTYFLVEPLGNLTAQYGVTSTCKIIDKSAMLVPWAAKMMAEKLLRTIPTLTKDAPLVTDPTTPDELKELNLTYPTVYVPEMPLEEFTRWVLDAKGAHKEKLEDASNVGHEAHQCLEDSIKHALATDPEKIVRNLIKLPFEVRAESCANAAKKWMDAHRVRWQSTEKKIYSRNYKYAGTLDGLAIYDSCTDLSCCAEQFTDQLVLVDWKSSNALRLEYILQVAAYLYAYLEEHGVLIEHAVILRLGKEDGEFESLQLNADDLAAGFLGFRACLDLLQCVDVVDERWKTKKQHRKIAQKAAKESAKELAIAVAKVAKAEAKAEAKLMKAEEKLRIQAEAKAHRDTLKAEAKRLKAAGVMDVTPTPIPFTTLVATPGAVQTVPFANIPSPNEELRKVLQQEISCIPMEEPVTITVEVPTE